MIAQKTRQIRRLASQAHVGLSCPCLRALRSPPGRLASIFSRLLPDPLDERLDGSDGVFERLETACVNPTAATTAHLVAQLECGGPRTQVTAHEGALAQQTRM